MTIEEKAKRYDEAIIRGSRLWKSDMITRENYEYIFPEVKDSEDELTWLKRFIKEEIDCLSFDIRDNEDRVKLKNLQRSLAWLEKKAKDKKEEEYIDLGLPSGLKWAKGNLKKSDSTYVISNETEYGDFWSWGNVGFTNAAGDVMTHEMYDITTRNQLTGNIPANAVYNVPRSNLGYPWRLPTQAEFKELIDNTDSEWTTINGVLGRKFMKKTDHSVYVFFPASGGCYENGLIGRGTYGHYWSSTFSSSSGAYGLRFGSSNVNADIIARYYGFSIRPVMK